MNRNRNEFLLSTHFVPKLCDFLCRLHGNTGEDPFLSRILECCLTVWSGAEAAVGTWDAGGRPDNLDMPIDMSCSDSDFRLVRPESSDKMLEEEEVELKDASLKLVGSVERFGSDDGLENDGLFSIFTCTRQISLSSL